MSAIKDYINLIPNALKNSDKIVEGIINKVKMDLGVLSKEEQDEVIRRRLICADCPFTSSNAVANKSLGYSTDRIDEHCVHCGCNIELKTSSLQSNCGIEVWNRDNPDSKIDLKWEAFNKTKNNNNGNR